MKNLTNEQIKSIISQSDKEYDKLNIPEGDYETYHMICGYVAFELFKIKDSEYSRKIIDNVVLSDIYEHDCDNDLVATEQSNEYHSIEMAKV